jgi:hypothetical protein
MRNILPFRKSFLMQILGLSEHHAETNPQVFEGTGTIIDLQNWLNLTEDWQ